jgi:Tfp pilus assembly protein PilX
MMSALKRLAREEAGMTMGLALMVIVLVGVMGAGLLVFARSNLEGVVESNRGQQAAELADAGLEAARRQLSSVDARPVSYDASSSNGDSEWSEVGCPSPLPTTPELPEGCGKKLVFEGGEIYVMIRFLEPSTTEGQTLQQDMAPEQLPDDAADANGDGYKDYPRNRSYFRVTVRATDGRAVRAYQAI